MQVKWLVKVARYVALIDGTEELIGHAHHIPFSKELLLCDPCNYGVPSNWSNARNRPERVLRAAPGRLSTHC